jgi:hypothetical protein
MIDRDPDCPHEVDCEMVQLPPTRTLFRWSFCRTHGLVPRESVRYRDGHDCELPPWAARGTRFRCPVCRTVWYQRFGQGWKMADTSL